MLILMLPRAFSLSRSLSLSLSLFLFFPLPPCLSPALPPLCICSSLSLYLCLSISLSLYLSVSLSLFHTLSCLSFSLSLSSQGTCDSIRRRSNDLHRSTFSKKKVSPQRPQTQTPGKIPFFTNCSGSNSQRKSSFKSLIHKIKNSPFVHNLHRSQFSQFSQFSKKIILQKPETLKI